MDLQSSSELVERASRNVTGSGRIRQRGAEVVWGGPWCWSPFAAETLTRFQLGEYSLFTTTY